MISRTPEVVTRKSRYSYGILCNLEISRIGDFDAALDTVKVDPDGVRVTPRMNWYLKKGDEASKKSPVLIDYHHFAKNTAPGKCVFIIQYSKADVPPKRHDATVSELCRIECDWDKPFDDWKQVGNPGEGWRKYDDLALAMRFGGQPKWTIRVGSNEAEHDVEVEYMS